LQFREPDYCAIIDGEKKIYRTECLADAAIAAASDGTTTNKYIGNCVYPACACKVGFSGDGHACQKATTTAAPLTTKTSTSLIDGAIMPEIYFYMNGSYSFVIGGRRAMRDSHFQQVGWVLSLFTMSLRFYFDYRLAVVCTVHFICLNSYNGGIVFFLLVGIVGFLPNLENVMQAVRSMCVSATSFKILFLFYVLCTSNFF
jgi:hypothetical protein